MTLISKIPQQPEERIANGTNVTELIRQGESIAHRGEKYIICDSCGITVFIGDHDCTTGYGKSVDGKLYCFDCCGKMDLENLKKLEPGSKEGVGLYFIEDEDAIGPRRRGKVTNWPGTLEFPAVAYRGRHNWAGTQLSVYFTCNNQSFYGRVVGQNSQHFTARKLKEKPA